MRIPNEDMGLLEDGASLPEYKEGAFPRIDYPAIGGRFAAVVADVERTARCTPALAGTTVLGLTAGSYQHLFDVQHLDGPVPISLITLSLAESGWGKSRAAVQAGAGLRRAAAKRRKQHTIAVQDAKEAKEGEPGPPGPIYVDDCTIETAVQIMHDHKQPHLLFWSPEAKMQLRNWSATRDLERFFQTFCKGWSGEDLQRNRVRDGGVFHFVPRTRITAVWAIQSRAGKELLAEDAIVDGFLPRALISVDAQPPAYTETDVEEDGLTPMLRWYHDFTERGISRPAPLDANDLLQPEVLHLDPDARVLLGELRQTYRIKADRALSTPGEGSSHHSLLVRQAEIAVRLAAILRLLESNGLATKDDGDAGDCHAGRLSAGGDVGELVLHRRLASAKDQRRHEAQSRLRCHAVVSASVAPTAGV